MSFSSNYTSTTSDKTVFVTWEAGFDNLKIYHEQSVVLKIDNGSEIRSGVTRDIDGLGKVELYLPNKAHTVHLTIDDETFTQVKPPESQVNLSGVSYLFWILTVLAVFGSIMALSHYRFNFSHPIAVVELILDVVAVTAYVLAAIFTAKNKPWGYFLGGIVFTFMSLLAILGTYSIGIGFGAILTITVRLAIIGYLISEFKKVRILMNSSNSSDHTSSELLDI